MLDESACPIQRIVSGGQTGADRGALDAAIELRIPHGGWCPLGRLAEDGTIPAHYLLRETWSPEYRVRTEQNVTDSDGTLIVYHGSLFGGTELTRRLAVKHGKPHFLVDVRGTPDTTSLREWIVEHAIAVLNVAGPRESSAPGISLIVKQLLIRLAWEW